MKISYIYTLSDPRTHQVRYVGKTNNPDQRRKAHGVLTREVKSRKKNWVKQLRKLGLKPLFEIVDEVQEKDWKYWEKYWISQFKAWGFILVNHSSGGEGAVAGNKTSFKKGQTPWNKGTKPKKICVVCKSIFEVSPCRYAKSLCCSRSCNTKLKNKQGVLNSPFKKNHIPWNKGKKGLSLKPKKNVHQYDPYTGEYIKTWTTAREASIALNISEEGIGHCCRGTSKSAGRYIWKYDLTDFINVVKNAKLKIK